MLGSGCPSRDDTLDRRLPDSTTTNRSRGEGAMANETSTMDLPAARARVPARAEDADARDGLVPGAVPHATTLIYVDDGSSLYVWTRPETTTAQHMGQNPVVSFAIDEYSTDCRRRRASRAPATARSCSTRSRSTASSHVRAEVPVARRARSRPSSPSSASRRRSSSSSTTAPRGRRRGFRHRLPPGSGLQHLPRPPAAGGREPRGAAADDRGRGGRGDRAAGRARGQVLHRRRRRGRGRAGVGWQDAAARTLEPRTVLRRDRDPPRHASRSRPCAR